ncbi:uncharacterized protein J4E84_002067 [Alternaria hordeiaustralica]|uniref:uncharacterized protein n=1 Tax=Alternaria hordeiaustralica TaxID=1187925 RepID=UPI0020C54AF2|nr:uncharacterized protein J4E84_002067 [Alternaria hordeiaustralica]KAI4695441.1 hypothetical protein J4E84_002067 [Alternaria hordeiaustralica]
MGGLCAVSFPAVYTIRMIERAREKARLAQEAKKRLRQIPQSCLDGVEALPVELWSQIIGYVLDPYLLHKERQCYGIRKVLEMRLVCHTFDKEIQRLLHQHLTLSQLPYRSFVVYDIQKQSSLDRSLRDTLLASALYRETQLYSGDGTAQFMAHRIKNCVLVAQHLSADYSMQNEQLLYEKLCAVASVSRCCWNYIFTLWYVGGHAFIDGVDEDGAFSREKDILLEISLLLAIGYQLAEVKRWMLRLSRLGMLVGYREHAVKRPGSAFDGRIDGTIDVCRFPAWDRVLQGEDAGWLEAEIEESVTAANEALDRDVDDEYEDLEIRFNV